MWPPILKTDSYHTCLYFIILFLGLSVDLNWDSYQIACLPVPILVDSLSYQTRSGEISPFPVDIIEALLGLCQTLHRLTYMQ